MSSNQTQNFANHARLVPAYHFVAFGLLALNFLWSAYRAIVGFSGETVMDLLLAVALMIVALYARVFALAAQDRVIRLEMRLLLRELLPEDLRGRIGELSTRQLIALRFASEQETPDLVRKVLSEQITDQTAIKKMIKEWRPDFQRV